MSPRHTARAGTSSTKRCFELVDGQHSKFWVIQIVGRYYFVTYGRIGTRGQTQVKAFSTDTGAEGAAMDMITSKRRKGYVEVGVDSYVGAPAEMLASVRGESRETRPESGETPAGKSSASFDRHLDL